MELVMHADDTGLIARPTGSYRKEGSRTLYEVIRPGYDADRRRWWPAEKCEPFESLAYVWAEGYLLPRTPSGIYQLPGGRALRLDAKPAPEPQAHQGLLGARLAYEHAAERFARRPTLANLEAMQSLARALYELASEAQAEHARKRVRLRRA